MSVAPCYDTHVFEPVALAFFQHFNISSVVVELDGLIREAVAPHSMRRAVVARLSGTEFN
jgi:hypothetical protein